MDLATAASPSRAWNIDERSRQSSRWRRRRKTPMRSGVSCVHKTRAADNPESVPRVHKRSRIAAYWERARTRMPIVLNERALVRLLRFSRRPGASSSEPTPHAHCTRSSRGRIAVNRVFPTALHCESNARSAGRNVRGSGVAFTRITLAAGESSVEAQDYVNSAPRQSKRLLTLYKRTKCWRSAQAAGPQPKPIYWRFGPDTSRPGMKRNFLNS